MILPFPLSEYKIMLFEIFSQQLLSLAWKYDRLSVLVQNCLGVEVPPPSSAFKQLKDQLCVVTPPDKTLIMAEVLSLKIELESVSLV